MIPNKAKNRGFTLIELLIVIAIVGVLSAVVLAALNTTRNKSRNVRRNSDVKQLVNAFNLGLTTANSYTLPPTSGFWKCVSTSCSTAPIDTVYVDPYLAPYISKPTDPTDSTRTAWGYIYNSGINPGGSFTFGAYLYWYVEPPTSSTICGVGTVRSVGAYDINCAYRLDQ